MDWVDGETYDDIKQHVLSDKALLGQVIVCSTCDMIRATDTINHKIGFRNLHSLLEKLDMIENLSRGVV
jgi:hypothetical protein